MKNKKIIKELIFGLLFVIAGGLLLFILAYAALTENWDLVTGIHRGTPLIGIPFFALGFLVVFNAMYKLRKSKK